MAMNYVYTLFVLIGCLASYVKSSASTHREPIVTTDCGPIVGKSFEVVNTYGRKRTVNEFANIPYAVPPKGPLRWRAPVDLKKGRRCWNGTLKYNPRSIRCAQIVYDYFGLIGNEDCLVLSVSTPVLNKSKRKKLLPVAVWIHGGAMISGHNRMEGYYPDVKFTATMNVVSVSINYRLNYFGFLSLEELWENDSTGGFGNYGIMDQILALKWVQRHIKLFGGDPNKVTIYGQSGGGTAAYGLLAASTGLAKGLFQKVVAMSGSPNYRTSHIKANEIFRPVLNLTNCNLETRYEVAKCLRGCDTRTILSLMKSMPMTSGYSFGFPMNKPFPKMVPIEIIDPIVVKYPLEEFVKRLKNSREKIKLDIMLGCMAQELPMTMFMPKSPQWDSWDVLRRALQPKFEVFRKGSYLNVLQLYREKSPAKKVLPGHINPFYVYATMVSDLRVTCTTARKAKLLASYPGFRVTFYVMSQPVELKGGTPQASHGYDSFSLFGYKPRLKQHKPTNNDKDLQKNIRTLFYRFFRSHSKFWTKYQNKTLEFWNNTIIRWSHPYHETECQFLRDVGLSKHAWGNVGIYNDIVV